MFCSQDPVKSIVLLTPEELCLPLGLTDQTVWALKTHSHEPWLPMKQAHLRGKRWCDIPMPLGNRLELRQQSSYSVRAASRRDLPVHLITLNTKVLESTFLQTLSFCCKNEQARRYNCKCLCFPSICQGWPTSRGKCLHLHLLTHTHAQERQEEEAGREEQGKRNSAKRAWK